MAVLVVSDDLQRLIAYSRRVECMGLGVREASSFETASKSWQPSEIQLVVIDAKRLGPEGLEFIDLVRGDRGRILVIGAPPEDWPTEHQTPRLALIHESSRDNTLLA